ncbi:helix-turn-helix transcriptional regulator [Mycolicibacterium arenosum]|uniref:Helix-turn-helix transcriptional regulator n=1 Tax=Mycolicibacterium arenosum TaxID=2952157 RepID=A0ABT1M0V7_9MYCO|nr:helix-turn-helix transcriptional regulator [Mycolicibacterium sp. CAU 1645]MCP9272072.1 helix-turn-helix transcriptional regulator [Mycolicibacterium sp. CAU 1645]
MRDDADAQLVQRAAPPEIGDVIPLLEHAEDADVLSLAGDRVTFTHPLLAQGVLSSADETRRRTAHGRLAEAVTEPEPRARHLALAATGADPMAVDALDEAATSAHVRGAPDAAAELTGLALRLGGDTPERRVQLARYHFDAGDGTRARSLLEALVAERPPGPVRSRAYQLLGMVRMFGDSFREAAEVLQDALDQGVEDESLAVMMRVTLALAQYNTGRVHIAIATVSEAIAAAEGIGDPVLLSQALAMRATVGFMAGEGFDEMIMRRALELEGDPDAIHVAFRPTLHNAFLVAWTGRNPHAHNVLREMYQGFLDAGDDAGLNILTFMSVVADIMYGAYAEAAATVETTLERAQQSGSGVALVAAETARAVVTAHTGDEAGTREAVGMAVAATELAETRLITMRAKCQLAFLEVSLGNYEAAWDAVQLSLNALENRPTATEAVIAEFLPDAIEAAVATGRRDIATALVELVEANGRRVDRPWMLMVAARGRALIAAANGDVSAAIAAAQQAMVEHDRLPMPFERARTQLLLGQLLRRRRAKDRATTVLTEALGTFDALGSRLWADRARAELARTASGRAQQALTAQETRVARLAAGGLTNREIAAALFISQKTVEATLARTYRKLGVRTRTELRVNLPPDSED